MQHNERLHVLKAAGSPGWNQLTVQRGSDHFDGYFVMYINHTLQFIGDEPTHTFDINSDLAAIQTQPTRAGDVDDNKWRGTAAVHC